MNKHTIIGSSTIYVNGQEVNVPQTKSGIQIVNIGAKKLKPITNPINNFPDKKATCKQPSEKTKIYVSLSDDESSEDETYFSAEEDHTPNYEDDKFNVNIPVENENIIITGTNGKLPKQSMSSKYNITFDSTLSGTNVPSTSKKEAKPAIPPKFNINFGSSFGGKIYIAKGAKYTINRI